MLKKKAKLKNFSKFGLAFANQGYKVRIKSNGKQQSYHEHNNFFCTYCPSSFKS